MRDACPNHLTLIVSGVCIHRSHGTIANKGAFVNRHVRTLLCYPSRAQQNAHFTVFPQKGFTVYFPSCLQRVWLLIILHLVVDSHLPIWDTDRTQLTLNYWDPLEKKTITRLKKQPGAQAKVINKVYFYMKLFCLNKERLTFHLMCRNKCRPSRTMKI